MRTVTDDDTDADDFSVDILEDDNLESDDSGELVASKTTLSASAAIRRKIEERMERKQLQEEWGVTDDELDW